MARKVLDDFTGEEISYPHISVKLIRVELSADRYEWLGDDDIHTFKNPDTLRNWLKQRYEDALDRIEDRY